MKTAGYWYKQPNGNWRFITYNVDENFDPMREPWLPMDGIVSFAFVTGNALSRKQIKKLYRAQRKYYGIVPWYMRLWQWIIRMWQ